MAKKPTVTEEVPEAVNEAPAEAVISEATRLEMEVGAAQVAKAQAAHAAVQEAAQE